MKTVLAISALALVAASALAADNKQLVQNSGDQLNIVTKGVMSANVSGNYTTSSGNHFTTINLQLGKFVSSNIEIRGQVGYNSVNSSNSFTFVVGGRYYFEPSQDKQSLPFAGVFYTYQNGSGINAHGVGFEAGIDYFLQPNISITPTLQYAITSGSGTTTDSFSVLIGLTYWFK